MSDSPLTTKLEAKHAAMYAADAHAAAARALSRLPEDVRHTSTFQLALTSLAEAKEAAAVLAREIRDLIGDE